MELTGFVSFRLNPHKSRKRRRPAEPQTTTPPPLIGHVFQDEQSATCYLLVVPHKLIKHVCEAAHYGDKVRLTRFKQVPLVGHPDLHALLEVHSNGFAILEPNSDARANILKPHQDDIVTLPEVLRREAVDKLSNYKSDPFTFRATVLAVSPILTFDPTDPCSLMELYDPSTACSCVIVLRLDSLIVHAAIRPGQDLILSRVKRMAWSTPSALAQKGYARLLQRIPKYVFVVDSPNQLEWCQEGKDVAHSEPPQASIVLNGTIESVHMTNSDSGIESFRYLVLKTPSGRYCNLFISSLPLPSDMQQSLQPGSTIDAYNLHHLSTSDYAACLRSTLVLVQTASESTNILRQRYSRNIDRMRPCAYLQLQNMDAYWICCHRLDVFLRSLDRWDDCVSRDAIVQDLLPSKMLKNGPRIAYAEFFDHGLCNSAPCVEDEGLSFDMPSAHQQADGCFLSGCDRRGLYIPDLVPLAVVHRTAIEQSKPSMEAFLSQSAAPDFKAGWTGSVTLLARDIFVDSCGARVYTGGTIALVNSKGCSSLLGSVCDSSISLPFSIQPNNNNLHHHTQRGSALLLIASVTVSFVYLGRKASENQTVFKEKDCAELPPFQPGVSQAGSCAIVLVSGHIFMASIRIDAEELVYGSITYADCNDAPVVQAAPTPVQSIRACLDPSVKAMTEAQVEGALVRKFFKVQKYQNETYKGSMFVFSHVSWTGMTSATPRVEPCTLQSIDMKPSVRTDQTNRKRLRETTGNLLGIKLAEEQLGLATAWWSIADNPRLCALLDGGWDELFESTPSSMETKCVIVRFPRSKAFIDEKRGYIRIRCSIDDLEAFPVTLDHPRNAPERDAGKPSSQALHFVGGKRFFGGMLSLRSRRRVLDESGAALREHGERLEEADDEAISRYSLAELHWDICNDLRLRSHTSLAPSLVRKVRNAASLGILYCSAVAECSKCFSSLRVGSDERVDSRETDGLRSSVPVAPAQPSFWNRRLDSACQTTNVRPIHSMVSSGPLRCPNKCSPSFAGIKWECSGLLDDGTGQAKLLAERDVALVWLGMTKSTVNRIEQGACLKENGIVFSKGMPPKPYLRSAVQTAHSMARDEISRRFRRPLCDDDVFRYLTPIACAEYLMQRHCRESKEPLRELLYYVRCKPLGDPLHLNLSRVDVSVPGLREGDVHRRDHATYTLPALKLNLVDCSVRNDGVRVNSLSK